MLRFISLLSLLAIACAVHAQTPYPPTCVQDVQWSSGDHPLTISNAIHAPCSPSMPVSIQVSATAELVSGTEVHLQDGFHAGDFDAEGRFRARIQQELEPLLLLSPEVDGHVVDNVLHVNKWEKLELGVILPQLYQDAIDNFFQHYYTNGPLASATPDMLDPAHDLNPYADDSLQLVMTLTKPSGTRTLKWGFFMREAGWSGPEDWAILVEDDEDPLAHCNVRFRVAPDEEGLWSFTISIQAPHTVSAIGDPLPHVLYSAHTFMCDPPLPDNLGPLRVNPVNRRMLQFEDGTSFFGMGTNMADVRGGPPVDSIPIEDRDQSFFKSQHEVMLQSMEQLHDVGGNFMRMFLMERYYGLQFMNLGVYDQYQTGPTCISGNGTFVNGNCQYQCWAYDRILDQARAQNIYVQLCIDPYPPCVIGEKEGWGYNPHWVDFIEPFPQDILEPPYNRRDIKRFFYTNDSIGQPLLDRGAFYYWKRKYKYLMSRWGYSVNIASLEPFNEINQMLSYSSRSLEGTGALCGENNTVWNADPALPHTLDQWLTDIISYVRDTADIDQPLTSPLGEDKKLFLMSYAGSDPNRPDRETYYKPFYNPKVDLIDGHLGLYAQLHELKIGSDQVNDYRENFEFVDEDGFEVEKPFHHGEFNYYAALDLDGDTANGAEAGLNNRFHNYDINMHNELWASTFYGGFAAGTSWQWDRVFWWPNAMEIPLTDPNNTFQVGPFSNVIGDTNHLAVAGPIGLLDIPIVNRPALHNFKPISDLLSDASVPFSSLISGEFTNHSVFDDNARVEAYYLLSEDKEVAMGWVHNMNAYWKNNYYYRRGIERFLACEPPSVESVPIPGFLEDEDYYITYYPTRMGSLVQPRDTVHLAGNGSTITLHINDPVDATFGGVANNFVDTLRSDYAFVISTSRTKSRPPASAVEVLPTASDFTVYPNPATREVFIAFREDEVRDVVILDPVGREVRTWNTLSGSRLRLPLENLAPGTYNVQVRGAASTRSKKLIIQ